MSHVQSHCDTPKAKRREIGDLWACECGQVWRCDWISGYIESRKDWIRFTKMEQPVERWVGPSEILYREEKLSGEPEIKVEDQEEPHSPGKWEVRCNEARDELADLKDQIRELTQWTTPGGYVGSTDRLAGVVRADQLMKLLR